MADERPEEQEAQVREEDRAASGVPALGWAIGDRFSWEEIHQRLIASADEEISSRVRELFFSGLTAGIAMVLTFIGFAVGKAHFPDDPFAAALLYPIGFVYIILGRYQLYTENTLSPVKLVLVRMASIPRLLQLWVVVLTGNLTGAALGAWFLSVTEVLAPDAAATARHFVEEGLALRWVDVFARSLFAGWLVAGVVWLNAAARDTIGRLVIVYLAFYTIGVTGLYHVVSASCEAFFALFRGDVPLGETLTHFLLPVLLGNTAGGVLVFALVAYAQAERQRFPEVRELGWRDMLFSFKGGRPFPTPRPRRPSKG